MIGELKPLGYLAVISANLSPAPILPGKGVGVIEVSRGILTSIKAVAIDFEAFGKLAVLAHFLDFPAVPVTPNAEVDEGGTINGDELGWNFDFHGLVSF